MQRAGPSTGLPTLPAQGDMMQARWGSHGDYPVIALCPNSPQECFDLTIRAFNLAEQYRNPVMFMMDECVGHMTEKVVIPEVATDITPRRRSPDAQLFQPGADLVPPMQHAGEGHGIHVTGLTHNERGYPDLTVASHDKLCAGFMARSPWLLRKSPIGMRRISTTPMSPSFPMASRRASLSALS